MKKLKYLVAAAMVLISLYSLTACAANQDTENVNWKTVYAAHDGLAVATDGNKYGFVDESGKTKLAPQWRNATYFSCGRAFVQEDEAAQDGGYYWRVIDEEGRYVCPYNSLKYYGVICPYIQNYAVVTIGEKYDSTFIIDRDGLPIHKDPLGVNIWPDGSLQKDGFFNTDLGLMNLQGELVIPINENEDGLVVETYLPAGGENGFPQGDMTIINPAGLIEVSAPDSKAGLYRTDGTMVVSFSEYQDYSYENAVSRIDDYWYYAKADEYIGVYRMDGSMVIDPMEGLTECFFLSKGAFVAQSADYALVYNENGEIVAELNDIAEIHPYKYKNQTTLCVLGKQGNGWIVTDIDDTPAIQAYESLQVETKFFEDDAEEVSILANGNLVNAIGEILVKDIEQDADGEYRVEYMTDYNQYDLASAFYCVAGGQNWVGCNNWAVPIGQSKLNILGIIYNEETHKLGFFSEIGVLMDEWDVLITLRDYLLVANMDDSHFRLYDYAGNCVSNESLPFDSEMKAIYLADMNEKERYGEITGLGNMVIISDEYGNSIYRDLAGNNIDPTNGGNFDLMSGSPYIKSGLIIVQNDHIGLMSLDGSKIIVEPIYDYMIELDNSRFMVEKDDRRGIIRKDGQVIIPAEYEDVYRIQKLGIFAGEFEIDDLTSRLDFYNDEGNLLAQANVYSGAVCYSEDRYSCEMGGLTYISSNAIRLAGHVIITNDLQIYTGTYSLIDGICYGWPKMITGETPWSITASNEEGQPLCGQIGAADERIYEE